MLASFKGSGIRLWEAVIVLANGCFDPLHYGHLQYLKAAKALGGWLIVSVTRDHKVNKGPGRPIFGEQERAEMVRSLRCVDSVILVNHAVEAITLLKPDIYVKGSEYEGKLPEQGLVEFYGGRVVFTKTPVYSSTKLITGGYFQAQSPGPG